MRLLRWSAEDFREFIQQAPSAMETTVRLIGPVAQMAESTVRQQEKLAALGTLSAGLAHEMNNPAAAARRTASELGEALDTLLRDRPPASSRAASSARTRRCWSSSRSRR